MRAALLGLLAAALATGCTYRGPTTGFAFVSTRALAAPMTLVAREVEGRSCIGAPTKERSPEAEAVSAALQNAPGANALLNARFELLPFALFRSCKLVVHGTAVRIEPR